VPGREGIAAASALGAYLTTVLPRLRRELRRWRAEAERIADPRIRRAALSAFEEKGSNVEAVAVFATLAPRARRAGALRAIAALQVAIDCRDSLEEAGTEVAAHGDGAEPTAPPPGGDYLARLERAWRAELGALPAAAAVDPVLDRAVTRSAEGQRRTHGAAAGDVEGLKRWARSLGPPGYEWWELAAGASSSVAAHALIAAAADPAMTAADAEAVDAAYFPSVGALTVILDDLVDREADEAAGEHSYLSYYADAEDAAAHLAAIAGDASSALAGLPRSPRHAAILAGVAAFYLSAPASQAPSARPIRERLLAALGPGVAPLAAFVRLRRRG
jgi:tetraprenyl-beta-curcumene synthase